MLPLIKLRLEIGDRLCGLGESLCECNYVIKMLHSLLSLPPNL